jgi:HEAT repeat protein
MVSFFDSIRFGPFQTAPIWLLPGIAALIFLSVLGLLLGIRLRRKKFKNILQRIIASPHLARTLVLERYDQRALLGWSGLIDRFARRESREIINLLGMDLLWIKRLTEHKRKRDFLRVLRFAHEKGLFQCFLLSLENKSLASRLFQWLGETGEFLPLRILALSGQGEEFSGKAAHDLFTEHLDEIREMAGDPEWACRYFSLKILLHNEDELTARAIWETFEDSHPLIRRTVAAEFNHDDRHKLYSEILKLLLDDPVFEVRRTAWERIHLNFSDLYSLKHEKLSDNEVFHILELLRINSKKDENFALQYLDSAQLDLRYSAALFLEKCGTLDRLCMDVDMGDRQSLERNYLLLEKAGEVNVTSFLSAFERTSNPATLLLCVKILLKIGHRPKITEAAKRVFRLFDGGQEYRELYETMLHCIFHHGNDEALKLLDKELFKRKGDKDLLNLILPNIPERGDHVFVGSLLDFFKDRDFPAKKELRETLRRMPNSLVLPDIFDIIKAERDVYDHTIRMQAIIQLTEMKMPYCLQTILENLPILPLKEARQSAAILSEYPRQFFIEKAESLLQTTDSKIRATLIACLPATGETEFLKPIRRSLKDADPEVRIASLWALVEFKDMRSLNQTVSMLRDPIERVRVEAGKALGSYGSDEVLGKMKEVLYDENEVESIQSAVIRGLGASRSIKSIDILIEKLEDKGNLQQIIRRALTQKTDKKEVALLIDSFKDAGPALRYQIKEVFKAMGEEGEEALVELIREEIPSLHANIAEILESTGFVASMVRKLSHRYSRVRRDAADLLSLLGTESAFRGMVLAARDPDDEVRVKVIRALEKLETDEGKAILSSLESDPDRRVRKYTHWALERLKAKSL